MKNSNLHKHLNTLLATEAAFGLQLRNAHWNLISPQFKPLHEYLGELYSASNERIDEIAERNRMIGGIPIASFTEFEAYSLITPASKPMKHSEEIFKTLLSSTQTIMKHLKKGIDMAAKADDPGTEDFLTAMLQDHEKNAWFLASHT